MPFESMFVFSWEFALCASKRLQIAVNLHMTFEVVSPFACVAALVATVELLLNLQRLLGMFCHGHTGYLHFHV